MGRHALARFDCAAWWSETWRERAGGHRRRRRCHAAAGRGAALRARAIDDFRRRRRLALANAVAVDRSIVRHVLASGSAMARPVRRRSGRDSSAGGGSPGENLGVRVLARDAAFAPQLDADRRYLTSLRLTVAMTRCCRAAARRERTVRTSARFRAGRAGGLSLSRRGPTGRNHDRVGSCRHACRWIGS